MYKPRCSLFSNQPMKTKVLSTSCFRVRATLISWKPVLFPIHHGIYPTIKSLEVVSPESFTKTLDFLIDPNLVPFLRQQGYAILITYINDAIEYDDVGFTYRSVPSKICRGECV